MISLSLKYQTIRTKLEQYLSINPQASRKFAIKYFQNFLALSIKYQELLLEINVNEPYSFPNLSFPLPLEYEFAPKKLEHYLNQYPEEAYSLAISHHEDLWNLMIMYKKLYLEKASPSLPAFLIR